MRTLKAVCLGATAAALLAMAVSCAPTSEPAPRTAAPDAALTSYGENRALIEDLQARYMFALDSGDVDRYVATFTEDGVLNIGEGDVRGRDAIRHLIVSSRRPAAPAPSTEVQALRPATGRHNITNIVLRVDGDRATGRAYWFHCGNDNPKRTPTLNSYGHYEDELVRVNGQWLFSKRRIYNEQVDRWAAAPGNPAW